MHELRGTPHEITFEWPRSLCIYIINRFWFRHIGWHGFLMLALMIAFCGYVIVVGESDWWVGMVCTLTAMWFIYVVVGHVVLLLRGLAKMRKNPCLTVNYRFDDDGVSLSTDESGASVKWRLIKKVWRFDKAWLLFFSDLQYVSLPAQELSDEIEHLIVEKVTANGGRVR